jgi:hypothetical protein
LASGWTFFLWNRRGKPPTEILLRPKEKQLYITRKKYRKTRLDLIAMIEDQGPGSS